MQVNPAPTTGCLWRSARRRKSLNGISICAERAAALAQHHAEPGDHRADLFAKSLERCFPLHGEVGEKVLAAAAGFIHRLVAGP